MKDAFDHVFVRYSSFGGTDMVGPLKNYEIRIKFGAKVHLEEGIKSPIKEMHNGQFTEVDPASRLSDEINRSIHISDVPLSMKPGPIKQALIHVLNIQPTDIVKFNMVTPYNAIWQRVNVVFKTIEPVIKFVNIFSIAVLGHCLRVTPSAYGKSTNELRNSCRLVIGGLPTNRELKAMDLNFLFSDAKAATVNIP